MNLPPKLHQAHWTATLQGMQLGVSRALCGSLSLADAHFPGPLGL